MFVLDVVAGFAIISLNCIVGAIVWTNDDCELCSVTRWNPLLEAVAAALVAVGSTVAIAVIPPPRDETG